MGGGTCNVEGAYYTYDILYQVLVRVIEGLDFRFRLIDIVHTNTVLYEYSIYR